MSIKEKVVSFFNRIFGNQKKVKLLNEPENINIDIKKKEDFIDKIKVSGTRIHRDNGVRIPINVGCGLGINTTFSD